MNGGEGISIKKKQRDIQKIDSNLTRTGAAMEGVELFLRTRLQKEKSKGRKKVGRGGGGALLQKVKDKRNQGRRAVARPKPTTRNLQKNRGGNSPES